MAAVGFGGLTGGGSSAPRAEPTPVATPTPTPQLPGVKTYPGPQQVVDPSKAYTAVIRTTKGEVRIRLYPDKAPLAVNSFVFLAKEGFYDGLLFHIVRKEPAYAFAQTGDPTCRADAALVCTGAGGPGYTLPLERNDLAHRRGAVALAPIAGGTDLSGSQFYILLADQPRLDGRDTVFGEVVAGMEVVEALAHRNPCFQRPSRDNPCQEQPPPGDAILSVTIQEG
ncbi:MAG TPA: peptidylprolyl isomerase [Dehalococcoidia bacterium]|nr:peptidylprolyl isomerase [Dehalococcoidia bacterium]